MLEITCRPQTQSMQAVTRNVAIPLHSADVGWCHCHSLPLIATCCHPLSLSLIVIATHCHYYSLSLIVMSLLLIVTHCHVIVYSFALYNDMTMQPYNDKTMSPFSCQIFSTPAFPQMYHFQRPPCMAYCMQCCQKIMSCNVNFFCIQ